MLLPIACEPHLASTDPQPSNTGWHGEKASVGHEPQLPEAPLRRFLSVPRNKPEGSEQCRRLTDRRIHWGST